MNTKICFCRYNIVTCTTVLIVKLLIMEELVDISHEIDLDIERGFYDDFPKLKSRLLYISDKIKQNQYIINAEGCDLTIGEVATLKENLYI